MPAHLLFFGGSARGPRSDGAGPAHLADAGLIRPSPGGWEKHLFFRITAILFGGFRGLRPRTFFRGASGPVPRGTFPSPEKYPKGRTREGPFRWGPSLMDPSPATTQRGAHAPLWIPPQGQKPVLYPIPSPLSAPRSISEIVVRIYCLGQFHPNTNRSSCHTCFG